MKQNNVDVAIVGYGPVSKVLAALLGQKGWKVGVYEKFPKAYPLPRAVHFDDETARILQSVIPTSEIERISVVADDLYTWCNAERKTLLALNFSEFGVSGWPGHLFFNQPELEDVLDKACLQLASVNVNLGKEAVGLTEYEDHVELIVKDQQGEKTQVNAKYVVGCDGANSFVRKNMEHTISDLGFVADWLVVDIIPQVEREWRPMNLQVCDPARPTTVVSGGPGRRRWEFMALPGETKEDLNREEVVWKLLEPWDITPENSVLERHAIYTFKGLSVDEWRKGRMILAGDAAHLTPPFMGQGMCSGIRDSKNLAWKLDWILSGKAEAAILDTYTQERNPHNREVVEAALYLGKVICVTDLEAAAQRDEAFFTGQVPPFPEFPYLTNGILHKTGDFTGKLSFQGPVHYRGKTALFDVLLGDGWTIISQNNDPSDLLSGEQVEFLKNLGVRFVEISESSDTIKESTNLVIDVERKYEQYFSETGLKAVVVRPDYYLFGGVAQLAELPLLVEELIKQLGQFKNIAAAR